MHCPGKKYCKDTGFVVPCIYKRVLCCCRETGRISCLIQKMHQATVCGVTPRSGLYGLMPVTGGRRLNCYGEFVSLTNEQIKKYSEQFGKISQFTGQEPELSSRMTIIAF